MRIRKLMKTIPLLLGVSALLMGTPAYANVPQAAEVDTEPAEIIELENDIAELRFEEAREIQKILFEFTEFLRPYLPDLLAGAAFIGEVDFLMAKAQTALDLVAGMPVISEDGSLSLRKARHP